MDGLALAGPLLNAGVRAVSEAIVGGSRRLDLDLASGMLIVAASRDTQAWLAARGPAEIEFDEERSIEVRTGFFGRSAVRHEVHIRIGRR
jgi:hypothetical protein